MKKRGLLVLWILCLGIGGCAFTGNETGDLLRTFDLAFDPDEVQVEETYDSYGFHGDGIAMYTLTFAGDPTAAFAPWAPFPLTDEAEGFLEGVSSYVVLPPIENGRWNMVDRSPDGETGSNVSFCAYDSESRTGYLISLDT